MHQACVTVLYAERAKENLVESAGTLNILLSILTLVPAAVFLLATLTSWVGDIREYFFGES